jgi:fatty acid desaturase
MAAVAAPGPRADLRPLLVRTNRHAAGLLALHAGLLLVTSAWVWTAVGSWWVLPAIVVDGVVMAHLFALLHECSHRSAFRSRRANQIVGWLCGVVVGLPPRYFRLEHTAHHRFTQQRDLDPELIDVPADARRYLLFVVGAPYWWWAARTLAVHAGGRLLPFERSFVPAGEQRRIVREARTFVAVYALAAVVSVAIGTTALLWLWVLPRLVGEPAMRIARLAEHAGRPFTTDVPENTRSLRVPTPLRLLAWNMPFHAEHHAAPSVPFHALPALHTRMNLPGGGYVRAHADILREMRRRAGLRRGGAEGPIPGTTSVTGMTGKGATGS